MEKHNLHELIEFDDDRFHSQVLIRQPEYRAELLSMRKGQWTPEQVTPAVVTVYSVVGHVTLHEASVPYDLHPGEVVRIDGGSPYRIEARADSALLILATRQAGKTEDPSKELDLRNIAQPLRHPLIFQAFDGLAAGEYFVLVNDHDPLPLRMQMERTRPGEAEWEYMERGPDLFRIRIKRTGSSAAASTRNGELPTELK